MSTRFIVNPFSGVGRQRLIEKHLQTHLDQQRFDYEVCYTTHPGHATELAQEAVDQELDLVVAVGGDGSVNEAAIPLVGSTTCLGILPAGSGNGLAMHVGMGRDIAKAIQKLNRAEAVLIDSCQVNGRPYVNLAGVGFDAWVAYQLKKSKKRGFQAYLSNTLAHAFSYDCEEYQIRIDDQLLVEECLMVEVANGPMFGYNFEVAPLAKLNDGLLEVMIFKKAPKWRYLLSAPRFLNKSIHKSDIVERFTAKSVNITVAKQMAVHIDGEGYFDGPSLQFDINPLSLALLIPNI